MTGRAEGRTGCLGALDPRDPARIPDMAHNALLPSAEQRPGVGMMSVGEPRSPAGERPETEEMTIAVEDFDAPRLSSPIREPSTRSQWRRREHQF